MKTGTKIILAVLACGEGLLAVVLYNLLSQLPFSFAKYAALIGVVVLSLGIDWLILHSSSAESISDAKKLKDADDYIRAFRAWLSEETPFAEHIKIAIRQLESLKRKQAALRSVLDDSKDSPFLSTAQDVEAYVLANCKRVINRVMIYDSAEPQKYNMHNAYLQQVLGDNARVLSEFENLILEVSQIGDDQTAATPCLTELTSALRSVRQNGEEDWEEIMQEAEIPQVQQAPAETRAEAAQAAVQTAVQTMAVSQEDLAAMTPPITERPFIAWSALNGLRMRFYREVRQLDGSYMLEPVPPGAGRGGFVLYKTEGTALWILPSPIQYSGSQPFRAGTVILSKFFEGAKAQGGAVKEVKPALFVPEPQRRDLYVCADMGEIVQ